MYAIVSADGEYLNGKQTGAVHPVRATVDPDGLALDAPRRNRSVSVQEVDQTLLGALTGALGGLLFVGVDTVSAAAELVRGVVGVGIGALVVVMGGYYSLRRISVGVQLPGVGSVTRWPTGHVERLAGGSGIVGPGALHGLRLRQRVTRRRWFRAGLRSARTRPDGARGPHPAPETASGPPLAAVAA